MPTVKVRNVKNEEVGEVELSDAVFGVPLNEAIDSRGRAQFHGQCATGHFRDQDPRRCVRIRSKALEAEGHWPRSHRVAALTALEGRRQRARATATRLVLQHAAAKCARARCAQRFQNECVKETFSSLTAGRLDKPKTKDFSSSLSQLGLGGKTLIVDSLDNENLLLSARNLRHAKVVNSFSLNIYDLLYHDQLVLSREAAQEIEQWLGNGKAEGSPEPEGTEAAPAKKKGTRKAEAGGGR